METEDVRQLAAACRRTLGDPATWSEPAGYPRSLGLCVLDSVWSLGVRYGSVENVLQRYRALRIEQGGDADDDSTQDLVDALTSIGDPDEVAVYLGNRQRTSSRSGILKSEAVVLGAAALADAGVLACEDVLALEGESLAAVKQAWTAVRGQGRGVSWTYLLLLAGAQEVKPDRMIIGFVADAIGRTPGTNEAAALVKSVARELGVDVRTLDHRIWRVQSERDDVAAAVDVADDDDDRSVPKLGDSKTQRDAEAVILEAASSQLDLPRLTPRTIVVGEGVSVTVDGAADGVVVEVYARQGKLKSAQLKKVSQDILKFRLLREVGAVRGRMLLVFASEEARDSVRGWVLLAARSASIDLVVVEVGDEWRARLLDAQARQFEATFSAVHGPARPGPKLSSDVAPYRRIRGIGTPGAGKPSATGPSPLA